MSWKKVKKKSRKKNEKIAGKKIKKIMNKNRTNLSKILTGALVLYPALMFTKETLELFKICKMKVW